MEEMAYRFAKGENIFLIHNESKNKEKPFKRTQYSVQEWLTFIRNLPEDLTFAQMALLDDELSFTTWTNAEIQFEWFLKAISTNYETAYPALKSFLEKVGRRKFILPLYAKMYKYDHSKKNAVDWFLLFKSNYHAVSSNSIEQALEL